MMKKPLGFGAAVASLLWIALSMHAQLPTMLNVNHDSATTSTVPLPQWDVVVVKPHSAADGMITWRASADGMSITGLSLQQMICSAWNLQPYQVSGATDWMKSTPFDLTAKVSGDDVAVFKNLGTVQRGAMFQNLLAERFQLKVHMVSKMLPVYNLVLDKGGPKLAPSTAIQPPSVEEFKANAGKYKPRSMSSGPGMFRGTSVPINSLIPPLSSALGRPVIDATHLTGEYDINLHFRPEETAAATADNTDVPSIFAAVQEQLGLKLVSDKGPVDTLVIDSAQKPETN